MNVPRRLIVFLLLLATAWAAAPALSGGLRSEDYLAVDYFARAPASAVLFEPHLDMRLFGYWRPLSDAATWGLVRLAGPAPTLFHAILLLLHVAAAALCGTALRRLIGLSAGAGLAASWIAAAHPWSVATVSYLDGGMAGLLVAITTFAALIALGRWRDGVGGSVPLWLALIAAGLAYDAALILPVIVVVVAAVLPRRERGVPWLVLLVVPLLLLLRWLAVGRAFDGYPLPPNFLVDFPSRLLLCMQRLFLPFFAELGAPRIELTLALSAIALIAVIVAIATRRGRIATPLRQGLALLLLVAGLLGYAPDLFTGGRGAPPDELVLAYKSYPAALAAALATGWLLGRSTGRRGVGSLVLALPIVAGSLWFGAPLRREFGRAQEWASSIPAGVRARASELRARRFVVFEVPVKAERNGRSIARSLQFGLASALRPPWPGEELFALPLFRALLDEQQAFISAESMAAFASVPSLEPLVCTYRIVDGREQALVERLPRPASASEAPVRLFARPDAVELALADVEQSPLVPVASDGSIVLAVRGRVAGTPRFAFLNRTHPFISDALDLVAAAERPATTPAEVELVRIRSPWLLEHAQRFPDDVTFVVLEFRPASGGPGSAVLPATVSNVVPLRLAPPR